MGNYCESWSAIKSSKKRRGYSDQKCKQAFHRIYGRNGFSKGSRDWSYKIKRNYCCNKRFYEGNE